MKKRVPKGAHFWNREYGSAEHLALSENPGEDLLKFLRWIERESGRAMLNPTMSAVDLGCGNGRNIIHLAKTYAMRGFGFDISTQAIAHAKRVAEGLPLTFEVRSLAEPLPLKDDSQALALDMMSSHVLTHAERAGLHDEVLRVLRPGGWYFLKTFLSDEDTHTKRLLKEHPGKEVGSYIHPVIGVAEYVFSEAEITSLLEERFVVHKVLKSHGHLRSKGNQKRRTISIYAQKA